MAGFIRLDEDLADLARVAGEILQGSHGHGQPRQLAAFGDAGDAPAMVQDIRHYVPRVQLVLLRVILVHDDVVGAAKRPALDILESAAHLIEAVQIDPADERYAGNRMHDHPDRQPDVGLVLDAIDHLLGNRRSTERQCRGLRRPHHDVGSDPAGAIG